MFCRIWSLEVNRTQMHATSQREPTKHGTPGDGSTRHSSPKTHIMQQAHRILGSAYHNTLTIAAPKLRLRDILAPQGQSCYQPSS